MLRYVIGLWFVLGLVSPALACKERVLVEGQLLALFQSGRIKPGALLDASVRIGTSRRTKRKRIMFVGSDNETVICFHPTTGKEATPDTRWWPSIFNLGTDFFDLDDGRVVRATYYDDEDSEIAEQSYKVFRPFRVETILPYESPFSRYLNLLQGLADRGDLAPADVVPSRVTRGKARRSQKLVDFFETSSGKRFLDPLRNVEFSPHDRSRHALVVGRTADIIDFEDGRKMELTSWDGDFEGPSFDWTWLPQHP